MIKTIFKERKARMVLAVAILIVSASGVVHHFRQSQAIHVVLEVPLIHVEVKVPGSDPPLQLGHYELQEINIRLVSDGERKAQASFRFPDPTRKPAVVTTEVTLTRGTYTARSTLTFRLPDGSLHHVNREKTIEIDDDKTLSLSL